MCKTICLSLAALLLSAPALFAQEKGVEIEPRAGFTFCSDYYETVNGGYNIGVMASFPITQRFYIQPGVSFFSIYVENDWWASGLQVPVFASYRLPVKEVKLSFNAGPFVLLGDVYDIGVAAEIGAEYKHWNLSGNFYQDFTANDLNVLFGLSLGYKFRL